MDRAYYISVIEPAMTLVTKKSEDYQSPIVELKDYFPFGDKSYVQMLHVKTMRLISLADNPRPNFESTKDTVIDLINYAVFYLDHLQKADHEF